MKEALGGCYTAKVLKKYCYIVLPENKKIQRGMRYDNTMI
jgi:hypothetical protein